MKKRSGVVFFLLLAVAMVCYAGVTYTSYNNKTGAWEAAGTWNGSKPSNTNLTSDDIINIYGYVTRNGNYTIDGNGTLNVYDTLVITGNLTMSQLSSTTGIQVKNGGLLIVLGNYTTGNSGGNMVNVNAGGNFVVIGNYDLQQGSVTTGGGFYIFDNTPTFNWGSTVDGTAYNNNTSTLTNLLDDETDLVANNKPLATFLESLGVSKVVCNATANYTTGNGAGTWTTAGDWSGSSKPPYTLTSGAYTLPVSDIVTIESGNFTLTGADLIVYGTLIVNGTLKLDAGKKIDIKTGGSVTCCQNCNASNKIQVGGSTVWTGSNGTVNGPATISGAGILPVKLTYFKIDEVTSHGVAVKWATSQEKNFDYYLLERAGETLNFQVISKIEGKGGQDITATYDYLDRSPASGKNYYRLKTVDLDGTFEYSFVIVAEWSGTRQGLSIYPNPILDHAFTIDVNDIVSTPASLSLCDARGYVLFQTELNSTSTPINLPENIPAGVYLAKVSSTSSQRTIRVVIK